MCIFVMKTVNLTAYLSSFFLRAKSYILKENNYGLAVSEILRYRYTHTDSHPVTLKYGLKIINILYISNKTFCE